ncbi:hypothetical protein SAMN06296386_104308 [Lachnospiraceae bacterium]|nr:hypothetical protein SAMN06296386_104308 [Lachnospiraceae bacterium]
MKRRAKKIMSLMLAVSMVFASNTMAFGAETAEGTAKIEAATADEVINAYEPIDGDRHGNDDIDEDQYAQVPDNWGINSDPATWSTSTKIVSSNNYYYDGNDDCGCGYSSYTAWTVYSPISYFFNPVDYHLVDGEVVIPKENTEDQDAKKVTDNVIYRVIPAGNDTFVLVRVKGGSLGRKIDVIRWSSPEKKERITETLSDRYNGDEPIVRFSGRKNVNYQYDKKGNLIQKKGEIPEFDVDAVLIKRENGKNTLVKGLSVKNVSFANNLNASIPEVYENDRVDTYDSETGSGVMYKYGYELTVKDGEFAGIKYVGPDYKPQLTKDENKNFKGQPSFTVSFAVKGDAKKYKKNVKKAEKAVKEGSKDKLAKFNFEIAQLCIGDWKNDKGTTNLTVQVTGDSVSAAQLAFDKIGKEYHDKFKAAYKERHPLASDTTADYYAEDMVRYETVKVTPAEDKENTYEGVIKFKNAYLFVDKEVDKNIISENFAKYSQDYLTDTRLVVKNDDVKYLKFGKNKVNAKLILDTSVQTIFTPDGSETRGGTPVGKRNINYSYVKTSPKAGGNADVVLTSQTVTGTVFGDISFAVAKGQNDLTGAMTMRLKTDAHGDDTVVYGHYKDENNYTVESLDE